MTQTLSFSSEGINCSFITKHKTQVDSAKGKQSNAPIHLDAKPLIHPLSRTHCSETSHNGSRPVLAEPQGAEQRYSTTSLSCLSVGGDINTLRWLTPGLTYHLYLLASNGRLWTVYHDKEKVERCVCVCAKELIQLFLSIRSQFIILPLSSSSPCCQTSLLLIIDDFLKNLLVILSAHHFSQVLATDLMPVYLCVSLCLSPSLETSSCHCHFHMLAFSLRALAMIASKGCLLTSSEFYSP